MTTYLTLVNDVLARLRETQVVITTQNAYSTLIGRLVNDAKREVEDAWNWDALYTTTTLSTAASTGTYAVTGAGERFKINMIYDQTNKTVLTYRPKSFFVENVDIADEVKEGPPEYYTISGVDSNGDLQVRLYPTPDNVYTLKFNIFKPEDELTADTDTTALPKAPIVALAWAKAIEERGEDGGVNVSSQYAVAKQALADAIAIEAGRRDDEITWYYT